MGYTMKTEGLTDVEKLLQSMGDKAQAIASYGLYEGAGEMADTVKQYAGQIQTEPFHYAVFLQRNPSPEEKDIVVGAGMGIAKFDKNGSEVTTSVGYGKSGYAMLVGKRKPIAKIANAINSGTSFLKKQPFFRKAVTAGTASATKKITEAIEKRINKLTVSGGETT